MTQVNVTQNLEVQQDTLHKRIERGQEKSKATLDVIQEDGNLLKDFILNLGAESPITFEGNGRVVMNIEEMPNDNYLPSTVESFKLHPNAIVQTGDKLGMNSTYLKNLAYSGEGWKHRLAAHSLNEFKAHTPRARVLVRAVGDEVRGVLSDHYKRIDSQVLYRTFITSTQENGMQLIDANYDGLQGYLEAVYPRVFNVPTPRNGDVFMAFGARMRTGDFGTSPYELAFFAFQTVCYNGMTRQTSIKQIHLGGRLPDDVEYAKETLIRESRYISSRAKDEIGHIMNRRNIEDYVGKIQNASRTQVDLDKEFKALAKGKMNKSEIEILKKVITNNRIEDGMQGENTQFKLSQAVGRVGVLLEDGNRKRELDDLANAIMLKS